MSPDIFVLLRFLVIACIRRANSLPAEPLLGAAEVRSQISSDPTRARR